MASFKFLLDNGVRHLASCFPSKQTVQLEDIGLDRDASDGDIVAEASLNAYVIVTNNRRDFEHEVPSRIPESSKKGQGCTQVHGLVIILPFDRLKQERAIDRASEQLRFEGKLITWKDVNELCFKVVIEETGKATVTKLPRCPHCIFRDDEKFALSAHVRLVRTRYSWNCCDVSRGYDQILIKNLHPSNTESCTFNWWGTKGELRIAET